MAKTIKKLLLMFAYGVMLILGAMFTVWASWKAVEFTSGDGKLTAQSGEKLTLAKRNEMVSTVRGVFTDSNGKVGIGTTSPLSSFTVNSLSGVSFYKEGNYNMGLSIGFNTSNNITSMSFRDISQTNASYQDVYMEAKSRLFTYNGNANNGLFIGSNGNVGIGTKNPSSKFHVDGFIRGKLDTYKVQGSANGTCGGTCNVWAYCNAGDLAISGGCGGDTNHTNAYTIVRTEPYEDNGRYCRMNSNNNAYAWVKCLRSN